ncbi:MAG: 3-dehydroquinate synthase [Pirellulaceae bacterium]|jgi:3-dehydroquinate synthase
MSQSVHVGLSERSYDIEIGTNVLSGVGEHIAKLLKLTHAVVITDSNVRPLYASTVVQSLQDVGSRVSTLEVPAGEQSKSIAMAERLWVDMLEVGADRKSIVVALGGGVVGDLAGFIAASFARGISLLQVPTTLLSQVDSSVGGKVGINLPSAKNMVGAFWQPHAVVIDTQVLGTLPDREYRSGLAEVVKYGVILDADFFGYLEDNVAAINDRDAGTLEQVVSRCCRLKADVVAEDERETTGRRAVLNYGHTFCHAIEAISGYGEYLHGEAVSIGMLCASRLAEGLGRVDRQFTDRQHQLLSAFKLPVDVPNVDHEALVAAMQKDKKVEHGKLRFVLPTRMGEVELVGDVDSDLVRAALAS